MRSKLVALGVVGSLVVGAQARAADWWVSPSGSDAGDGSKTSPFATVQRAADVVQPGDTVFVRAGVYRESVTLKVSGREDAPITFAAAPGETPTLSGADIVAGTWTKDGDRWSIPIETTFASTNGQAEQLFFDGKMLIEARWPNVAVDQISTPKKATVTAFVSKSPVTTGPDAGMTEWVFVDSALSPATDGFWVGAMITLQPSADKWSWVTTGRVVAQSGTRVTIHTWSPTGEDGNADQIQVGARYFLAGKLEALDADGEWFHDVAAKKLFARFAGGVAPAGHAIELKRRDWALVLDGKSYVTVQGLRLFAASLTTDTRSGTGNGGTATDWRTGVFAGSSHVVIDSVTADYPSHFTDLSGHMMGQWGQNTGIVISGSDHVVKNSVVRFSAGNGISALGPRHRVFDTVVEDACYSAVECGCLGSGWAIPSVDADWHNVTCRRTGRSGLQLRTIASSDPPKSIARIHHCDVSDFMLQDFDGGAFYVFGQDGRFTRIDHNVFHRAPSDGLIMGAYWDYSKNYVFDHNVIWGVRLPVNSTNAFESGATNNLIVVHNTANAEGMWAFAPSGAPLGGSVFVDNVFDVAVFTDPKGTIVNHVPDYSAASVVDHDLVWGGSAEAYDPVDPKTLHAGVIFAVDAGFVDFSGRDLHLAAGSPAVDRGIAWSTVDREGIAVPPYDDPIVGAAPDLGAYELGSTPWTAGAPPSVAPPASDADTDAGVAGDASRSDGEASDGGRTGDLDARAPDDEAGSAAGSTAGGSSAGCGCATPNTRSRESGWMFAAIVVLGVGARRRDRTRGA